MALRTSLPKSQKERPRGRLPEDPSYTRIDNNSNPCPTNGQMVQEALKQAQPIPGRPNQLQTILPDGTRIIFRMDTGSNAHPLRWAGEGNINHVNIEVHTPGPGPKFDTRIQVNQHILLDAGNTPTAIYNKRGVRIK